MASAARGTLRQRVRGCEQRVGHARFRSASGAFACLVSGALIASGCGASAATGSGTGAATSIGTDPVAADLDQLVAPTGATDDTGTAEASGDSSAATHSSTRRIIPLDGDLAEIVSERGEELATRIEQGIAAAGQRADDAIAETGSRPRLLALYLRGENVQLVLGAGSGIDWIIEFVGAIDVADELGVIDNAPINAEAVVVAAPDVLLLPEGGLESVGGIEGLLAIPGIAETPAGRNARVLAYDDQYLLGNGPRTPELLDELITALHGEDS